MIINNYYMVYVDKYTINEWLQKVDFYAKYPMIKNNDRYLTLLVDMFQTFHGYCTDGERFIRKARQYFRWSPPGRTVDTFLASLDNRHYHKFTVYHKKDIKDFYATTYITNLMGKPIEEILETFINCNCVNNVCVINTTETYKQLKRIMDAHLVIKLAKIFSVIETFISMDVTCPLLFTIMGRASHVQNSINLVIKYACKKNLSVEGILDNNNLPYVSKINNYINNMDPAAKDDVYNYINKLSELNKTLCTIFYTQNVDTVKKIISTNKYADFDAEFGMYVTGRISFCLSVNVYHTYLGPALKDIYEEFASRDPLNGLVVPTSTVDVTSKLIVEV